MKISKRGKVVFTQIYNEFPPFNEMISDITVQKRKCIGGTISTVILSVKSKLIRDRFSPRK